MTWVSVLYFVNEGNIDHIPTLRVVSLFERIYLIL